MSEGLRSELDPELVPLGGTKHGVKLYALRRELWLSTDDRRSDIYLFVAKCSYGSQKKTNIDEENKNGDSVVASNDGKAMR